MKYPKTITIGGKTFNRIKFKEWLMKETGCSCDVCIGALKYKLAVKQLVEKSK